MSNLSELLPSGGGQNVVEFTASGAISAGDAVALKSDGTVGTITGKLGTKAVFESSVYSNPVAAYDTANDKIVVAYGDSGSSNQGTAVVGTISGNTISFGTPVVFNSGAITGDISIVFDTNSGKFVISYRDGGNSDYGTAIVGTVSGTSISFGSETVFNSRYTQSTELAYDSNAQKVVIAYGDWVSPSYPNGTAIVGTVSGTSISFGTAVAYRAASANIAFNTIAFDSTNNKVVICYRDGGNSDYGTAIVGTVSGTSISFGSAVVFQSAYTNYPWPVYDTSASKMVVAYSNVGNDSSAGTIKLGTVSGTSISFGSAKVFQTDPTTFLAGTFNTATGQSFFSASVGSSSPYSGEIYPITVSGSSITVGTKIDYISNVVGHPSLVYDPDTQQVVITFKDGTASNAGTTRTIDPAGLENTDFIGLAAEAISDAATGNINVKGGINEAQTGLTIGSEYYVGSDGTISTTNSGVKIGQAISSNTINMRDLSYLSVEYLIVAGGGAGAQVWGGGGAGGLLTDTTTTEATTYTIIVGAGGAGLVYTGTNASGNTRAGNDSSALGITATGGGGGDSYAASNPYINGGSGGGGAYAGGLSGAGGTGIPGQGNDGGTGWTSSGNYGGGGGGGAGAVGGNGAATTGGNGGVGLASSITGSSVYYAGGGGGGTYIGGTAGSGGNGGGGAGSNTGTDAAGAGTDGTANTGGGGGGAHSTGNTSSGANGGSGVVILRTLSTAIATTGSPTVTTDGSYNIYKFTGSGSITF